MPVRKLFAWRRREKSFLARQTRVFAGAGFFTKMADGKTAVEI
jgi:hypothetical protein